MMTPRSPPAAIESASEPPDAIRMSSSSSGGADLHLVEIDRLRVVGALDHAARHEFGDDLRRLAQRVDQRWQPDGQPKDRPTAEPALCRRADPNDGLAIELGGVSDADHQHAAAGELAASGDDRRVPLALQLTEREQRAKLAADAPIELVERSFERRILDDGDDEDVRGDLPGLIRDDSKLHGVGASDTF